MDNLIRRIVANKRIYKPTVTVKTSYSTLLFCLAMAIPSMAQQKLIKGTVLDSYDTPLAYVNVFVQGTMDGAATNEQGFFSFTTTAADAIMLVATFIGYQKYTKWTKVSDFEDITIILQIENQGLDEIVVYAGNYNLKSASTLAGKSAIDLVTTAGSEGDLYRAISLLPGAQAAGPDGRLLIRGGSARETQTFIDGMHVLSPYTASSGNFSSRGRYSPFLFEGINFSMGGYSSEYSQSLSAILPLETKNISTDDKLGLDLMNVSIGGGGTKAWDKGSTSFNVNYTNLSPYNNVFYPSIKKHWNSPFKQFSAQQQLRFELGKDTYLKTYFAYDKTDFNLRETDLPHFSARDLDYKENNIYLNSTFSKKYTGGFQFFSGVAYSRIDKDIKNGLVLDDQVRDIESELHLKTKGSKRFSNRYKMEIGLEGYLRKLDLLYEHDIVNVIDFNNNIYGLYVSNDFNINSNLFVTTSARLENTSLDSTYAVLPRVAVNYTWQKVNFSGVFGLYQQSIANDYLMRDNSLGQEKNIQSLFGMHYKEGSKVYRVELYNKQYRDLAYYSNGRPVNNGKGFSRGVDVFFSNTQFMKNWNYMIAYSFNDTKRQFEHFNERITPNYVTKHNLAFTLKYTNYTIKSIIGITERFASGRQYHDPTQAGFMQASTPNYNTLDLSYTFLVNKNLIFYTSFTNILNREHVFNYQYAQTDNQSYVRRPVQLQQNQSFYIGFFLTLGKNVAYDVSNF